MARCHERMSRASKSKLAVWQSGDAAVAILTSRPVASNFGSNLRAGINEGRETGNRLFKFNLLTI